MVDGPATYVRAIVDRARDRNITVEAGLSWILGGEDVVAPPVAEMTAELTDPAFTVEYVRESGIQFLAPSFGNIHGEYPEGGPEGCWDVGRLGRVREALEGSVVEMGLHGTSPACAGSLVRRAVSEGGVRKVDMIKMVREGYTRFLKENAGVMGPIALQEGAVEVYVRDVGRTMREILGSTGTGRDKG